MDRSSVSPRSPGVGFYQANDAQTTHHHASLSDSNSLNKSPSPSGLLTADIFSGLSSSVDLAPSTASAYKFYNMAGFDPETAFNGFSGAAYPMSSFSSSQPPASLFDTSKNQVGPQIQSGVNDELSNMLNSFNTDLLAYPFDFAPASASASLPSPTQLSSTKSGSGSSSAQEEAAKLDRGLDSPLGLSPASYSDFFASPLFEDAADLDVPGLDPDFGPSTSYPSLFPSPAAQTPALSPSVSLSTPLVRTDEAVSPAPATLLRPNPPPPARPTEVARASSSSSSVSRSKLPKATGFRGTDTALIPVDAPIQQRRYVTASSTSRKRKTTLVERELAKRQCLAPDAPTPSANGDAAIDDDIPEDLRVAVERKRLQNTVAARRSRARKQERLAELEQENGALVSENEALKARVEELEQRLLSVGLKA